MMRWQHAVAIAALISIAPGPGSAGGGSRAVVNLPDGRLLAVVGGGGSQSVFSMNGVHRIETAGIVIDFAEGRLTVDGEPRDVPPFKTVLEIRIIDGEVVLAGDP